MPSVTPLSTSPTPTSTFRTLVLVHADIDALSTWTVLEAAARDDGAEIVVVAGRSLFVFARPHDALRFCLALPERAAGCRLAAHVGGLPADAAADPRGERMTAATAANELLLELIAGAVPGQRLLSRSAATLLRRAAHGQALAMPTGWECRIGSGDGAPIALSLDPLPDLPAGATVPSGNSRQPLPSRPHWWLERTLPPAGPLQRARLRNHKSGVHALLQFASDGEGLAVLQAQRAALRDPAVAGLALPPGDGELDALPAFLVSEISGLRLLGDDDGQPPASSQSKVQLLQSIARSLAIAHAAGCAHGAFDAHAVALAPDGRLRFWGLRREDDPAQRSALQERDCAALGRLLFGLLAGDPQRELSPFWQREVDLPAARRLIESCLDPAHPQPVRELPALLDGLQALLDAGKQSSAPDATPTRRWWQRRPSR
jgi:hypothetical protein